MNREYRLDIDTLKAISIIGVVFYHIGWLDTGYLGVDVFFAINGFFILPSLLCKINKDGGGFSFFNYFVYRIMRLWPLIIIATILSLGIGYYGMLPDHYENLSQSVIASDLMAQNILSAITTKNYWDAVNEYKPLMHLWYVGILVQFYVFMPLLLKSLHWCCKKMNLLHNFISISIGVIWSLLVISFLLYILPVTSIAEKFYYLPCRLYELLAGGLVGIYLVNCGCKKLPVFYGLLSVFLILSIICGSLFMPIANGEINPVTGQENNTLLIPQCILLVIIVLLTCLVLISKQYETNKVYVRALAYIGKISFSIFIWHQIILAFYRYYIDDEMSTVFVLSLWSITLLMSLITYYGVEQKIKPTNKNFIICTMLVLLTLIPSSWIYINAGVIRDVPELNVQKDNVYRGMFAEYCDRVYKYNKDFEDNNNINVLIVGNSFGRDFANVLLESEYANNINLSYIYEHDIKYVDRYNQCDILFTFSSKKEVPYYVWDSIKSNIKVYGIGIKNYGSCNGIIYKNRHEKDYFQQEVMIDSNFYKLNDMWKKEWGSSNYIDFISLTRGKNGGTKVFTDDNKFISQDCRHLTKEGAIWYAKIIDFERIFN